MAATLPQLGLAAVVAVAGSSVAWQALVDGRPPPESRFTHAGTDLPWAPVVSSRLLGQLLVGNPLRRLRGQPPQLHTLAAYEAGLHSPRATAAALPLERVDAPLLLLAGEDDAVWPAAEMARAIVARRGHRGSDRVVIYAGTGHISLRPPGLPATILRSGDLVFGGEPRAFAAAMGSCWTEVIAHLDAHLRT
jgi:pimeloyl-ACP methyl ester carboxylesterase